MTPLDTTPHSILCNTGVCLGHHHPNASAKLAHVRIGKTSPGPAINSISLVPASFSVPVATFLQADVSSPDATPPHLDGCIEPDLGKPLAPPCPRSVRNKSLLSSLLDRLVGSGILEPASAHRRKSSNELLSDDPACDDVLESRAH